MLCTISAHFILKNFAEYSITNCINEKNVKGTLSAIGVAPIVNGHNGVPMKYITAIIKPFKLNDVREALAQVGVQGMTVTEVKGFGRQKGHTELYRGAEYIVDFIPKTQIQIGIDDAQLEEVVSVIVSAAGTGKIGDGKLFVTDLESVVRIRTGETGPSAL